MHSDNPYLKKKPDFARLASRYPNFAPYVTVSDSGYPSIDFQNPSALRELTKCLLKEDWDLNVDLREDRLCPTIPNRLDYIYHLLDLEPYLSCSSRPLRVLDIGTGATAIYPILLSKLRPTAQITATELDESSYRHANQTLQQNKIATSSVTILHSPSPNPILFPLLQGTDEQDWDFTMCNPPFYGSAEEMQEGAKLKEREAHAAPTASDNELITKGGEVAFISSMMRESMIIKERCRWYTSLVGKYSSLEPLVGLLRELKIDNYFIKSFKQARTSRWIVGWSHTTIRLPDRITRPELTIGNTLFTQLLPPPNTITFDTPPSTSLSTLKTKVLEILKTIALDPTGLSKDPAAFDGKDENVLTVFPHKVTWSRAARRQFARQEIQNGDDPDLTDPQIHPPLFRARLTFTERAVESGVSVETPKSKVVLEIDWLEGKQDARETWENFWKFLLSKAGLTRKRAAEEPPNEHSPKHQRSGGTGRGKGRLGFSYEQMKTSRDNGYARQRQQKESV